MKKICLILPTLSGGGAERVLINLANYFAQQGLLVDLVIINKRGAYINDVSDKVNLINLNKSRVIFSLFTLVKYFKKTKLTVILTTMPHISLVVILAKFLSGITTNLVIRQPNYLSLNSGNKWWVKYYIKLTCLLFNRANKIIGISQGVCDDLVQLGVEKAITIYNPAVFPKIFDLAKQKIDVNFDKKTFIAVGRLVRQKNFSLLINAFAQVKKTVDAQLIILGEGELRGVLEQQIKDLKLDNDVQLLGFVDNPYAFMKQSDVFVLSSSWEGFGNVVAEALALGTQVVSTNCPSGPSEILENGKYGFLVEVNNTQALAEAMVNALYNPISKVMITNRSQDFRIEKIAKQYQDILLDKDFVEIEKVDNYLKNK